MNKRYRLILISIIAILLLSASAFAQGGPGAPGAPPMPQGPGGPHGGPMGQPAFWKDPKICELLGLSNDQIKSLEDLEYSFREQVITQEVDIKKAHMQLERLVDQPSASDQEVTKAAAKVADLQGKMFVAHTEHQQKIKKVLTADQWKKLKSLPPPMPPGQGPGCPRGGPEKEMK
jgi:Spy/CpxP family protein refolding chaperone